MYDKFIGIPFEDNKADYDSADCFGIIRLFYKEVIGIEIFKHTGNSDNLRKVIMEYLKEAETNWTLEDTPKKFDVIAMAHDPRHPKIIQHFGIMVSDTEMLHTLKGLGSHIVNITEYQYYIKGIHRWRN